MTGKQAATAMKTELQQLEAAKDLLREWDEELADEPHPSDGGSQDSHERRKRIREVLESTPLPAPQPGGGGEARCSTCGGLRDENGGCSNSFHIPRPAPIALPVRAEATAKLPPPGSIEWDEFIEERHEHLEVHLIAAARQIDAISRELEEAKAEKERLRLLINTIQRGGSLRKPHPGWAQWALCDSNGAVLGHGDTAEQALAAALAHEQEAGE